MAPKPSEVLEKYHPSVVERFSRGLARGLSRRNLITMVGAALTSGCASIPLLPSDRRRAAAPSNGKSFGETAQTTDDTACNFWRYCALDGYLCTCCGGGVSACPPGTVAPPTAWIGSCLNPDDGETYLIVYRDCCGAEVCSRCSCLNLEGEMPVYRPQLNGDIIWCFGTDDQMAYNCTHAAVLSKA